MAFWSGETLTKRLPNLIEPYDPSAIDCAAYTLHVGREVYVSPDGSIASPDRHTTKMVEEGGSLAIPPGQFAFLVSEENVAVPDNAIAFISIKARVKFRGLINISGFHVDPGYRGRLLFSVLNAGPRPLHVRQGQELFLIWYADLDGSTQMKKSGPGFERIEAELINGISGEILSLQSLSEQQRLLETKVGEHTAMVRVYTGLAIAVFIVLIGLALGPHNRTVIAE